MDEGDLIEILGKWANDNDFERFFFLGFSSALVTIITGWFLIEMTMRVSAYTPFSDIVLLLVVTGVLFLLIKIDGWIFNSKFQTLLATYLVITLDRADLNEEISELYELSERDKEQ